MNACARVCQQIFSVSLFFFDDDCFLLENLDMKAQSDKLEVLKQKCATNKTSLVLPVPTASLARPFLDLHPFAHSPITSKSLQNSYWVSHRIPAIVWLCMLILGWCTIILCCKSKAMMLEHSNVNAEEEQ